MGGSKQSHVYGSSIEGFIQNNESDMYLYPDLIHDFLGEMKMAAYGLICDVYTTEGDPFAGDPRGNSVALSAHGRTWSL